VVNIKDEIISVRQCTEPTQAAKNVYDLMNFKYTPFVRKKFVAPLQEFLKMTSFIIRILGIHNCNVG
jgi:hypothetical protein